MTALPAVTRFAALARFALAFAAAPAPKPKAPLLPTMWRADGSANSHRYRVTRNGEPVPSAFAADTVGDEQGAWVDVYGPTPDGALREGIQRLRGVVAIVLDESDE